MAIISFTNYKRGQTTGCMGAVMRYTMQDKKTEFEGQKLITGIYRIQRRRKDCKCNTFLRILFHSCLLDISYAKTYNLYVIIQYVRL